MIIRPLTVYEREAVRHFYLALVPDDRRKRFCCSLSDETVSSYVDRIDFTRDTILAAFDEQARIIGLAELVRGAGVGEMAFSVLPDMRCQRIGTQLMEGLLRRAKICGIRKVFVVFLPDNTPMRRMASRAGMALSFVEGEAYAERELPAASADELTRWLIEESLAHGGYFGTLGMARWNLLLRSSASAAPTSLHPPVPTA
ncbi:MAG TPA: GNAT family N-acetyltransferase [Burkholderiales bacterium]|nr:GNAT family N-acetyltransferase [Burkholderiales bacterium]